MKLLLTGATGFVGRNILLQALREKKYQTIWLPVRSREKLLEQLRVEGFSELPESVRPILSSAQNWNLGEAVEADHVIHAAGVLFAKTRDDYFSTNVEGTLSLVRSLKASAKVVLLSSQAAAGPCQLGESAKSEFSPENPLTWYGRSKLEMEHRAAAEFADRMLLILRPPMILGPRDQATLPLFKMAKSKVHFKPGFRKKWFSYISVGDLVSAVFTAFESPVGWNKPGIGLYFIASDEPISDKELIASAAEALDRQGWLVRVPQSLIWVVSRIVDSVPAWSAAVPTLTADRAKEIWPNRWVVSSTAFQQEFGWKPLSDLVSVLTETGEWYRKTGQLPV